MKASFFSGKKVLITGVTGFIGPHLAAEFSRRGARVLGMARNAAKPFIQPPLQGSEVDVHRCDILDYEGLLGVLGDIQPEIIVHLAAQSLTDQAAERPGRTVEVNTIGTVNLMDAIVASEIQPETILIASSSKVFGLCDNLGPSWVRRGVAPSFYAMSKFFTEQMVYYYHIQHGLPLVVTRCANIYGLGDLNLARIVPSTFRHIIAGRQPRVDSDVGLEMVYIDDVVEAHCKLIEACGTDSNVHGKPFAFGSGKVVGIVELVNLMLRVADATSLGIDMRCERDAASTPSLRPIDGALSMETLGWEPSTELEEGLRTTYGWYRQFFREHRELLS